MAKASRFSPPNSKQPVVTEEGLPTRWFLQFLNDVRDLLQTVETQQTQIEALQAAVADLQDQIDTKCP